MDRTADIVASEHEVYYPSPEVVANAHIKNYEEVYARSLEDPQAFWAERASHLEWYHPWDQVLDESNPPFYKWFQGGKTNICLLYTSPSPRDRTRSRMPSSA